MDDPPGTGGGGGGAEASVASATAIGDAPVAAAAAAAAASGPAAAAGTVVTSAATPPGVPGLASQLAFDVYVARFKARSVWTVVQLGSDLAAAELEWWSSDALTPPLLAYDTASAHGDTIRSGSRRDDPAALNAVAERLQAAVIRRIGAAAFDATWDAKRSMHIVSRELVAGYTGDSGGGGGGAGGAGTAGVKRPRTPDTTAVVVLPRAAVPRLSGTALYTCKDLQPDPHIQGIFAAGRVRYCAIQPHYAVTHVSTPAHSYTRCAGDVGLWRDAQAGERSGAVRRVPHAPPGAGQQVHAHLRSGHGEWHERAVHLQGACLTACGQGGG